MTSNAPSLRLSPLASALRRARGVLTLGALLALSGSIFAATAPTWDCRVADDGRSWSCSGEGVPPGDPAPATPVTPDPPAEVTPSREPPATPAPAPSVEQPAAASGEPLRAPATVEDDVRRTTQQPASPPQPAIPLDTPPESIAAEAAALQAALRATSEAAQGPADKPPAPSADPLAAEPPTKAVVQPDRPSTMPAAPLSPAPRRQATPAADAAAMSAFSSSGEMPDLVATPPSATAATAATAEKPLPPEPIPEPEPGPKPEPEPEPKEFPTGTTSEAPAAAPPSAEDQRSMEVGADPSAPVAFAGALDAGIDWHSCRVIDSSTAIAPTPRSNDAIDQPIAITADAATAALDPETATFSGNVQLLQGTLEMRADRVTLDRATGQVSARGGVLITDPDLRVAGSEADYQMATRTGAISEVSYRIPAIQARGDAEYAALVSDGVSQYQNISYTTCGPDSDDWLLEADSLELDHNEGLGTARHAKLRFMGAPILYAPTFTFPIDDRRRSGVLIPSIGSSDSTGLDLRTPYYINLAPNYDLTLVPRVMSKRGFMLGGEFRFLTGRTKGALVAEVLPDDREYDDGDSMRGSASLTTQTWFNAQTEAALRLNYVSDNDYLDDLGDSLAVTSATHLERTGEVRYHAANWDLLGRAQYYQTIDDTLAPTDRPYSRLPQVRVDLEDPDGLFGTTYHLNAEYANFYRKDSVRGHRIDLFPALSLPLGDSWRYLEPKIGARYTGYRLTDEAPGANDSPSEVSGLFSVDSGMVFDRSTQYFDTAAIHTLEPRLYYLLVPNGGQDDQPIFDTALLDFSFDNLFRENRFAGADRFGDANQVTLALTSRVLADASGEELLRASIGQIVYFDDREVTLPGDTTIDDSSSAVVAEIDAALGGGWRSRAGLQWDPNDGSDGTIDQALAQISYRDQPRDRVFNAAYRLRDGVVEQTDLAAIWPISERLSLIGRHNYSLRDERLLEALVGVEYGKCCWRIRAVARKFANGSGNDQNLAFLLQLELNGLGRFGNDIGRALERQIYGYEE